MSEVGLFTDLSPLVEADPFALLGISVSAEEKQLTKRYRQIAKQLHPDILATADPGQGMEQAIAAQVIARLVNPSYQKLKQEKSRQQTLSLLRLRVRHLVRTDKLVPTFPTAQQLLQIAASEVDTFYEQALSQLAQSQFQSAGNLHSHTLEISQLNLVFLCHKMENSVIRTKRPGLMVTVVTPTAASAPPDPAKGQPIPAQLAARAVPVTVDYVQKHIARAQTYLIQQNYDLAVQELREALKITPQSPELHSMMGQAYYKLNLSGMAKTHFRQALKLQPTHQVAQKYGKLLGITAGEAPKKPWLSRLLHH
ncbi:MAG: tetratricopeptide repeat protein [Phormidesmis sp.]